MTTDQIKKMKTHELAEILTSVAWLLNTMPNIECGQLIESVPNKVQTEQIAVPQPLIEPILDDIQTEQMVVERQPATPLFTHEELKKKTVVELKSMAKGLNVFFSSAVKKDELIHKILTRPSDGKSEQHAIRNL
ncbi:MAG: Rho termination factor N-terminal domain-containing protein [Ktedonobacteraceae bacterium]|nr:Rho termination factor N-terminal domain-containing protein [Ktedonobacteraceae bacterium]